MKKISVTALALCAALVLVVPALGATSKVFTVKMTGKQEVPKGSPTGHGTAKLTLTPARGRVCFNITWSGIGKPVAAHIHKGAKGKAGPVVVPLFAVPPKHTGCVKAKKTLVSAIVKHPGAYYVNVHTKAFPAGALRAQL